MKSEVRLLPHLNSLYLQQKQYEVHRKKIQTIKKSLSSSKRKLQIKQELQNIQSTKSQTFSSKSKFKLSKSKMFKSNQQIQNSIQKMQTIEQVKDISYWMKKMTPLQKRIKQQQIKQNKRLKQRIKKSVSFITAKGQIQNHKQKFDIIKNRLMKYHSNQNTNLKSLKCQTVLKKISQLEKEKMKIQQSRIKLFSNIGSSRQLNEKRKKNYRLSIQINSRDNQAKHSLNNRYIKGKNHTQLLTQKKFSRNSSSRTSLSQINCMKMPNIKPNRLKTEVDQSKNEQNMLNRANINRSKLSKISAKSYISENNQQTKNYPNYLKQKQKQNMTPKVTYVTSYNKYNKKQLKNSITTLNKTQKIQNKFKSFTKQSINNNKNQQKDNRKQTIIPKNMLNQKTQSNKKIDYQRKKIQRYYTYKHSYLFKTNLLKMNQAAKQINRSNIQPVTNREIIKQEKQIKMNLFSLHQSKNQNYVNTFATQI